MRRAPRQNMGARRFFSRRHDFGVGDPTHAWLSRHTVGVGVTIIIEKPMHPRAQDEESLIDLPPLDGGADDEGIAEPEDFEGDDVLSGEGDLDDSTGESDPIPEIDASAIEKEVSLATD